MSASTDSRPQNLPEGLNGYVIHKTERVAYLPVVANPNEGNGAVGRLLDSLKADHDVVVVSTVTSERLQGMLERRGFCPEVHCSAYMDEPVECMVWRQIEVQS